MSGTNDVACGVICEGSSRNTSLIWQIQNPNIKCDVCVLDSALNNEYAALLLSGKALPINISSYVTQMQSISGQTPSVDITRALSRLKSVFCTFDQAAQALLDVKKTTLKDLHIELWKQNWNDFFHPMSYTTGQYDVNFEMEMQLQVGSKLYPEYPVRSTAEAFYQLRKCMGIETSNFHSLDITPINQSSNQSINQSNPIQPNPTQSNPIH